MFDFLSGVYRVIFNRELRTLKSLRIYLNFTGYEECFNLPLEPQLVLMNKGDKFDYPGPA